MVYYYGQLFTQPLITLSTLYNAFVSLNGRHIWSYVRVVLSCMDRFDLVTSSSSENIAQLASSLNVELINTN